MCISTPIDYRILEVKESGAYVLQHTQARGSKGLTESHLEPWFHHSTADKYSMAKTDSAKTVLYS